MEKFLETEGTFFGCHSDGEGVLPATVVGRGFSTSCNTWVDPSQQRIVLHSSRLSNAQKTLM